MSNNFRKSKAWNVLSWVLTILAAFVAAVLINTYLLRTSNINGSSMDYSYHAGQLVILSKTPYIFGSPEYKDVVVFDSNCFNEDYENPGFLDNIKDSVKYNVISQKLAEIFGDKDYSAEHRFWIKRVIGVAGDKIEFKDGLLYKNGEPLKEDYIKDQTVTTNPEGWSVTVPEGYVFLCGDNRNASMDCRYMRKCVPVEALLGKVLTGADPQPGVTK